MTIVPADWQLAITAPNNLVIDADTAGNGIADDGDDEQHHVKQELS